MVGTHIVVHIFHSPHTLVSVIIVISADISLIVLNLCNLQNVTYITRKDYHGASAFFCCIKVYAEMAEISQIKN